MPRLSTRISHISAAVLRCLADAGPITRTKLSERVMQSGLPATAEQIRNAIMTLTRRNFISLNGKTRPGLMQITRAGRAMLDGRSPLAADTNPHHILTAPVYQPRESTLTFRPGAMDAFSLPSRTGKWLRWPTRPGDGTDSTVSDLNTRQPHQSTQDTEHA